MPVLHDCAMAARKIMEHRENHDPLSPTTIYSKQGSKSDQEHMFYTNDQKCHHLLSLFWKFHNHQQKFTKLISLALDAVVMSLLAYFDSINY